jgi:hypothetical protein
MAKIYVKNTWVDEVLAGSERYNILADDGTPIESAVQVNLSTAVAVAGTAVDASKMNNIEVGLDAIDTLVAAVPTTYAPISIVATVDAIPTTYAPIALQIPGDELTVQQRRDNYNALVEGFDGGAVPAGFSWAGSPFNTPSTVDLANRPSIMRLFNSGASRSFLYTSTIFTSLLSPIIFCGWQTGVTTSFIGLRIDDGTDNNCFEWLLSGDLKATVRTKVGGGAYATVQGSAQVLPFLYGIRGLISGTRYSSFGAATWFCMPGQGAPLFLSQATSATTTASWTPTRYGVYYESADANRAALVDAIYTTVA